MNKVNTVVRERNTKYLFIGCLVLISLCYMFFTIIFRYEDSICFTVIGVEFWECIFKGDGISSYYSYVISDPWNVLPGAIPGSYLTWLPWILWNLPLFLSGVSVTTCATSTLCLLWSKMFLLVNLGFLYIYIYKAISHITNGNVLYSQLGVLLTAGSLELLDSVAYTGQDEIVYLNFLMISFYMFIKGKKLAAIGWGIAAVTVCPLMIIPFCLMTGIYFENFFKAVGATALSAIPTLLFEFVYRNDTVYASLKGLNTVSTFQMMMNTCTIHTAIGSISIGAVILVLLGVYCYFIHDDVDKNRKAIIVTAITFVIMTFLMDTTFYRSCIYIPFLVLFLFIDGFCLDYKVIAFWILGICKFSYFITNSYNFATRYLADFVTSRLAIQGDNILNPTSQMYDSLLYITKTAAAAAVIVIFVLYFFKARVSLKTLIKKEEQLFIVPVAVPIAFTVFFTLRILAMSH